MLLTSFCLASSILGYGYYLAIQQTNDARLTITAQINALALNLATVDAHFLETGEPQKIEMLTLQTATVPGIYSVLVTDVAGKPVMEVVNKNGAWSPRYGLSKVQVPSIKAPDSVFEINSANAGQLDFLAGNGGTMSAWRRIAGVGALGWVRVNYRLDTFDILAKDIRTQAFNTIALAIIATLLLLWLLLRPSMRALREATEFAGKLDSTQGGRLHVTHRATEIEALGNALNVVSERLAVQNIDIRNQQFAMDQHAIVSITDLNGLIIYANQRFCDISGYRMEELIGQNHRIVKSAEHPATFYQELWHTITQGNVWHGEVKNRRKDGGFYWVSATIVPLLGVDGLPQQYIGIRTDITSIKELEHSLQIAKNQAEAATQAKGQFLANMSHEIRTPMNAVLGMLKLLQNTDLSKRQLDYASKAEGAAQSLLGLINDILDFSKIDAGKMTLEVHAFRLDKLLRDLSVIVSANVGAKPVEVLFDIDPRTPKSLMGDAMRLQQVLINLCGNAVKFTALGEVVISIKVMAQSAQSVTLRVAVRDSGIGISPDNQKHIFDGFSQAEASTTRRFGGTGLGLSISKRLVSLMGGELTLESVLGTGSIFSFVVTLPIADERLLPNPKRGGIDSASNLSVLVVDDNPTAREVLAAMAESLGWRVDVAADGPQALAMVQTHADSPYQAIFMDWQMPVMDGWETVVHMQDFSPTPQPPIVVMVTAHGREMLTQRSAQDQARLHGFLVKPVTASMLFDSVSDALASRKRSDKNVQLTGMRPQPLHGMRLLVVEDNLVNQQVAQEMLASEGAQVEIADNGQLGVDAVRRAHLEGTPFDVVLMDIQMPVMDGYTATRLLRQDIGFAQLPIIAMTANAMASDREACLAAGMNAHVGKPFNLVQLVGLVKNPPALPQVTLPAVLVSTGSGGLIAGDALAQILPPIDAVDVVGALDRLGGNQTLYARVLESYLEDIAKLPDQFDACLGSPDLDTAARMLHTLKGLSATVGASYLAAVARQAEQAVKSVQNTEVPSAPFNAATLSGKLRAAIVATQAVMGRVAQSFAQSPANDIVELPLALDATAPANATMAGKLAELHALLRASNMRALGSYEQLRVSLAAFDKEELQRLHAAINSFDFTRAAQACHALMQKANLNNQ